MKNLLSNQARIFIAIVEAGSITGAADRLQMGKSGISEALKQLETALGTQLLVRTTRRQTLTTIGKQFYQRCRELNDISLAALEEVNEHLADPRGPLRITAPHATIDSIVAPAIAEITSNYPRLQPELIVDDKRLDLIRNNIDVALTAGELPDSEFKAQRVGVLRDVLCATPDFLVRHSLTQPESITPEQTAELPYISHHWEGGDIAHQLTSKASGDSNTFTFQPVATASSVNAVCALITQSVGVGILPHFFLKPLLENGALIELLPDYHPRETTLFAIHPYGTLPPISVRAMIKAMKHNLGSAT